MTIYKEPKQHIILLYRTQFYFIPMAAIELHNRLIMCESAIAALTAEVSRLSFNGSIMKTSVPLRPAYPNDYHGRPAFQNQRKPVFATQDPVVLTDLLQKDEEVTIQVNTGKDNDGNFTTTSAIAIFNGSELVITVCCLIPSLVGSSSVKPGELLYKFINELKEQGHISRTFTVPPWRLCTVLRDGKRQSLSDLRQVYLQSQSQS